MNSWTIDRLGRRGDGVAVGAAGRALAPLVLPGEVIEGEAVEGRIAAPRILTPSADRVRPVCGHYRACGGCSLMHASEGFTAAWKQQVVETALAAQGIAARVGAAHVSPPRSRRRAVFSGRRTKKGALVGFHARASDVIVDLVDCPVIRPEIQAALPLLRQIVVTGASRDAELSLVVIHGPAGLDVAVTGGKPMEPALFQALAGLADEGDLARLDWDGQSITRRAPALPLGRALVVPPPAAFLQATAEGEAALLAAVKQALGPQKRVVDLFSGVGTFALPLAESMEVHAVEGDAAMTRALDLAARNTPNLHRISTETRDLFRRPLEPDELNAFTAAVIDPPRAGAEAQTDRLAASRIPVIAAVSCNPVTFARDAKALSAAGYRLDWVQVVDQFRWSTHVELVARFSRTI